MSDRPSSEPVTAAGAPAPIGPYSPGRSVSGGGRWVVTSGQTGIDPATGKLVDGGVSEVVPVRRARDLAGDQGIVMAVDCNAGGRWPAAGSFVAIALRAGLTMLRGRTRGELAGADLAIAPPIGESGWMRPQRIPSFAAAGDEALVEALPELRRLLADS